MKIVFNDAAEQLGTVLCLRRALAERAENLPINKDEDHADRALREANDLLNLYWAAIRGEVKKENV